MEKYIIAIDLGTSRTSIVIATYDENEPFGIKIRYKASQSSQGIQRGMVTNIEKASKVLSNLLIGAEKEIKSKANDIKLYCFNINGLSYTTECVTKEIQIPIDMTISETLINKLWEDVIGKFYINDHVGISCKPVFCSIDDSQEIINPSGRSGSKLEGKFLLTFALTNSIKNIHNLCKGTVDQVYTTAYAKSAILINPEDKKTGTMLVDLGTATTSIAIYYNNTLRHDISIPLGSQLITNDIARGLNIPKEIAENLKCNLNLFIPDDQDSKDRTIEIKYGESESVNFEPDFLFYIIKARVEEIIKYIDVQVIKTSCNKYIKKIILTGGGAKLYGITKIFEEYFVKDTFLAETRHYEFDDDSIYQYAAAIGMASLYAREHRDTLIDKQQNLFETDEVAEGTEEKEKPTTENATSKQSKKTKKSIKFADWINNILNDRTSFSDEE